VFGEERVQLGQQAHRAGLPHGADVRD
jgi:hypothetical protein